MNRKLLCLGPGGDFCVRRAFSTTIDARAASPGLRINRTGESPGSPAGAAPDSARATRRTRATTNQAPPVIRVQVNEVPLIFTVTDSHGHYIPNLQQSDFALLDDQRAPAKVNRSASRSTCRCAWACVIDTSTSIHSRFQFEQQSATEFLLEVLKAKGDRAFVMGFDVTPDVTQDWTNDLDALETGVNKLKSGGGTALFDAVYTACRDKLLTSRGPEPVRKAMILISDGDDNQSRVYLRRSHQGVPARRHDYLRHQHQLDAEPRPRRQGDAAAGRGDGRRGRSSRPMLRTWRPASAISRPSCAASMSWTTRRPISRPTDRSEPSISTVTTAATTCTPVKDTSRRRSERGSSAKERRAPARLSCGRSRPHTTSDELIFIVSGCRNAACRAAVVFQILFPIHRSAAWTVLFRFSAPAMRPFATENRPTRLFHFRTTRFFESAFEFSLNLHCFSNPFFSTTR